MGRPVWVGGKTNVISLRLRDGLSCYRDQVPCGMFTKGNLSAIIHDSMEG